MSEEKRNRNKSLAITGAIQLIVLLVLYFLVAWKEPYPPIEEFGIELAFDRGGARTPPKAPQKSTEVKEPTIKEVKVEPEVEQVEEVPKEPLTEPQEVEVEQGDEPILEEVVEESTVAPQEETETTQETPLFQSNEETQEEEVAAPVIDSRSLFTNSGSNPNEGASLQLTGWIWDFEPTPYDDSSETGKVVFKVTIDNEGYILSVVTQSSTLTPSVEKYYRQAVERLTFSKTSAYKPAATSSGTITFIIKSD